MQKEVINGDGCGSNNISLYQMHLSMFPKIKLDYPNFHFVLGGTKYLPPAGTNQTHSQTSNKQIPAETQFNVKNK